MSRAILINARAEALFVSNLQRSDRPGPAIVASAIRQTIRQFGSRGCAERVAYAFGETPETAMPRMAWARSQVQATYR